VSADARATLRSLGECQEDLEVDDSPDRYGYPFDYEGREFRPVPTSWLAHGAVDDPRGPSGSRRAPPTTIASGRSSFATRRPTTTWSGCGSSGSIRRGRRTGGIPNPWRVAGGRRCCTSPRSTQRWTRFGWASGRTSTQCTLVTSGETLDLPDEGEVVEHTDTDQGLRIWYRIPHDGTPNSLASGRSICVSRSRSSTSAP